MRQVFIDDGEVYMAPLAECTGVAARWCPIHGDCTDAPDEDTSTSPYSTHCSDFDCPLHGERSQHAETPNV